VKISISHRECRSPRDRYQDVSTGIDRRAARERLDRIAVAVADSPDLDFARLLDKKGAAAKPRANAEAWSLMLYTSGTTSRPKGVPRRHRAERAAAVAHVAQNLYSRGERTLGVMPLYHTMGVRRSPPCRRRRHVRHLPRFDAQRARAHCRRASPPCSRRRSP
jgi:long-subunit acyl-CoA synthetase (AMP-forming)